MLSSHKTPGMLKQANLIACQTRNTQHPNAGDLHRDFGEQGYVQSYL